MQIWHVNVGNTEISILSKQGISKSMCRARVEVWNILPLKGKNNLDARRGVGTITHIDRMIKNFDQSVGLNMMNARKGMNLAVEMAEASFHHFHRPGFQGDWPSSRRPYGHNCRDQQLFYYEDLGRLEELNQHIILEDLQKDEDSRDEDANVWWPNCRLLGRVSRYPRLQWSIYQTWWGQGEPNDQIVEANTSYNILLGRPSLYHLGAIVSTPHLVMKFPSVSGNILTVHVDLKVADKKPTED